MNPRALEAGARVLCSEFQDRWSLGKKYWLSVAQSVITAYETHLKAEGFVVVRAEPTDKMICAALDDYDKRGRGKQSYRDIYRAMLSAATTGESDAGK